MKFANLVIDRVDQGIFEKADGTIVGALNQVQNLTINTTTDPKDAVDARGVLIKRFYTAKNVELSAENAILNLDLAGLQFGQPKVEASSDNKIVLPRIMQVKTTSNSITLPEKPLEGTLTVYKCNDLGLPETRYNQNTVAGTGEYAISSSKVITLPTDSVVGEVVQIKYEYETEKGAKVVQTSDKFPDTCKLTLSVLVCDPCDAETLRHAYIVFPSFQLSPDMDLSVATDAVHGFSGSAQVDFCSVDKNLYYIAISDDDVA